MSVLFKVRNKFFCCPIKQFQEKTRYCEEHKRSPYNLTIDLELPLELDLPIYPDHVSQIVDYIESGKEPQIDEKNIGVFNLLAHYLCFDQLSNLVEKYADEHANDILKVFLADENAHLWGIYEDILSKKILDYVDDLKVKSLPPANLMRILQRYLNDHEFSKEILDFIISLFEVHFENASIFCSLIPLTKYEDYFLNEVFSKYDRYFNPTFLKPCHFKYLWEKTKKL